MAWPPAAATSSPTSAIASSSAASSLTATTIEPAPCSAWASRSSRSGSGSAPVDAMTVRSLGPANPSIPTSPDTWRLASCTHRLPGPTITSAAGIVSVP